MISRRLNVRANLPPLQKNHYKVSHDTFWGTIIWQNIGLYKYNTNHSKQTLHRMTFSDLQNKKIFSRIRFYDTDKLISMPPTRKDLTQGFFIVGVRWRGDRARAETCVLLVDASHWFSRCNVINAGHSKITRAGHRFTKPEGLGQCLPLFGYPTRMPGGPVQDLMCNRNRSFKGVSIFLSFFLSFYLSIYLSILSCCRLFYFIRVDLEHRKGTPLSF